VREPIAFRGVSTDLDLVGRLRADIVNGAFSPGERLKFAPLSKRYDAGFGTLREALSQLVLEGFATQEVNKGFAVAPVSREELSEIVSHYIELEQRALISAIATGDDDWEANVVAAHHQLQAIEKRTWEERVARHSEWVVRHRAFHAALVAACSDRWLLRLRTLMFDQLDRYRFLTKMAPKGKRASRSNEHKKIMNAVISRDAARAVEFLDVHIRGTADKAMMLL